VRPAAGNEITIPEPLLPESCFHASAPRLSSASWSAASCSFDSEVWITWPPYCATSGSTLSRVASQGARCRNGAQALDPYTLAPPAVNDASDRDVTRRTMLAAERTWLAWWRSGIAAATASVAVGGVVPQLVGGSRTPYVWLGAAYGVLAIALFVGSGLRQRQVDDALERGGYLRVNPAWVVSLAAAGGLLALATVIIIIVES
jgi:putative membrane protein